MTAITTPLRRMRFLIAAGFALAAAPALAAKTPVERYGALSVRGGTIVGDNGVFIHCVWSANDKKEGAAMLKPGGGADGQWTEKDLTASGRIAKRIISGWGAPEEK